MDDAFLLEKDEASQELARKTADQWQRKTGEVVRPDELVQVDGEAGRDDAEV